jgi:YesN/AraC family two-component response regulator
LARILVIDDDAQVREMLREMLERVGHEVIEAADGSGGMKLFRENPADVVVTDIFMPEKDGIVTIQELRTAYPDLGIIALSGGGGFQRFDFLETARRLGASAILRKPVDWEELTQAVSELLNN